MRTSSPHIFTQSLLLIFACFPASHAAIVRTGFRSLAAGANVTGTIAAELTTMSELQCSRRCSDENRCLFYRFVKPEAKNCLLIHGNSTAESRQTFTSNQGVIYRKYLVSARFWSFDNDDDVKLNNGARIVHGQVNKAVQTDGVDDWVDLGFVTDACITRPETCGPEGAALAMWINAPNGQHYDGLISSHKYGFTGFVVYFYSNEIRFATVVPGGYFDVGWSLQSGWHHYVMNFIGSNEGEGIVLYVDGAEVTRGAGLDTSRSFSSGDDRVVVGRSWTNDGDDRSGHGMVDELMMFNHQLSDRQIQLLYHVGN